MQISHISSDEQLREFWVKRADVNDNCLWLPLFNGNALRVAFGWKLVYLMNYNWDEFSIRLCLFLGKN
ncbi:hypothetical protein L1049_002163 [Liquidambar formosana]|uniref:Uncharacterized protein n=1 Tax=Liquidambar formosana TaxID=63359 RepID=A0AAP0R826_LIQFO